MKEWKQRIHQVNCDIIHQLRDCRTGTSVSLNRKIAALSETHESWKSSIRAHQAWKNRRTAKTQETRHQGNSSHFGLYRSVVGVKSGFWRSNGLQRAVLSDQKINSWQTHFTSLRMFNMLQNHREMWHHNVRARLCWRWRLEGSLPMFNSDTVIFAEVEATKSSRHSSCRQITRAQDTEREGCRPW